MELEVTTLAGDCAGVYAEVPVPGDVSVGDEVLVGTPLGVTQSSSWTGYQPTSYRLVTCGHARLDDASRDAPPHHRLERTESVRPAPRRDPRREPHPVRPRQRRSTRRPPTRTCSPRRSRAWSPGSAWPASGSARWRPAPCSSTAATSTSPARRCSARRWRATTPAYDVQQACGTGLETTILVANKIALGQVESGIAGGVDSASDAPIAVSEGLRKAAAAGQRRPHARGPGQGASPRSAPATWSRRRRATSSRAPACPWATTWRSPPRSGASPARPRTSWPCASHQHLAAAYERGFFDDLVTPYLGVSRDTNLRPDTSLEKLGLAHAGVRQGRGRDDDRRQLHAAHRRRLGRAAGQRRLGGGARADAAGVLRRRRDRGGRLRARRRGPAHGALVRRAAAARAARADAAGLRPLRDPRGVRLHRADDRRPPGRTRRSAATGSGLDAPLGAIDRTGSTSPARRWPPATRSPRPAAGSSPPSRNCCTRRVLGPAG